MEVNVHKNPMGLVVGVSVPVLCIHGHIFVPSLVPPYSFDFITKFLRISCQLYLYPIKKLDRSNA